MITHGSTYRISIGLIRVTQFNREAAGYTSTLAVTGDLPGVYEYTVSNRAMTSSIADSIYIEGNFFSPT